MREGTDREAGVRAGTSVVVGTYRHREPERRHIAIRARGAGRTRGAGREFSCVWVKNQYVLSRLKLSLSCVSLYIAKGMSVGSVKN